MEACFCCHWIKNGIWDPPPLTNLKEKVVINSVFSLSVLRVYISPKFCVITFIFYTSSYMTFTFTLIFFRESRYSYSISPRTLILLLRKDLKEPHATSGEDASLSESYFRFSPPNFCGARESACASELRHTSYIKNQNKKKNPQNWKNTNKNSTFSTEYLGEAGFRGQIWGV